MIGRLCIVGIFLAAWADVSAEEAPSKNPFAKPTFMRGVEAPVIGPDARSPLEPPQLRAILLAADGALANIDGTLVAAGEEYAGYRVMRISEEQVVLRRRDEQLVLELFGGTEDE